MNYEKARDGSLREFNGKAACPCCGRLVRTFLIADVTAISITSEKWACDSCWQKWQAQLLPIDPDDDFLTDAEWLAKFAKKRGTKGKELKDLEDIAARSVDKLERWLKNDKARGATRHDALIAKIDARKAG